MKWKNLAIVAAIFAALFSWVYFYEIKGEKTREEAAEKEKKIFQFEEKDIAQITVKNADGEFVLQKDKDNWKLAQPLATKADKSSADSLASDIAQAKTDTDARRAESKLQKLRFGAGCSEAYGEAGQRTNSPIWNWATRISVPARSLLAFRARTRF